MLMRQNHSQNQRAFAGQLLKSFALIVALWTIPQFAVAETGNEEIIQDSIPQVVLENNGAVLKFKVSENTTYEIQSEPDLEKITAALSLDVTGSDPLAGYRAMSADEKNKFQERRLDFLKNAARVFHRTKFALGVGSLVGRSFNFVIDSTIRRGKNSGLKATEALTLQQRSDRAAQNLLQSLDYRLWSKAPLFIASNEYGISMSVGFMALKGFKGRGQGGGEELGINLGFNTQSRAFVFEIFHSSENFKSSLAPVGLIGFPLKAGPFMTSRVLGAETLSLKGESFYPPALPGFSAENSEFATSGFNSSLSLPPSPLVDFMTYTNSFDRKTLIRITVSPLVVGYLRIQFGDFKGSVTLIGTRVADIVKTVAEKIKLLTALQCRSVFS